MFFFDILSNKKTSNHGDLTLRDHWLMSFDGWSGDRTLDPRIKSPLLCQLS